jgi:hypothetical protein
MITKEVDQRLIFDGLMRITDSLIPQSARNDSLSFLLLPMEASCPSCRKKVIDSILKHKMDLRPNQYIIISSTAGLNAINAYFVDRKGELPVISGQLFIDSTNYAKHLDLYDKTPMLYYTFQQKAYKKVSAIPSTVKDDLSEFFSGHRKHHSHTK